MPGRTWVVAPDAQSLKDRWRRLVTEKDAARKAALFHPHLRDDKPGDKHVDKSVKEGLPGHEKRTQAVAKDTGDAVTPTRYAFRSFDRQWILPDPRLINQPNPTLWKQHSNDQVYFTALSRSSPKAGPAFTIAGLVPDLDHFKGSFGGRVLPLWADAAAAQSNLTANALRVIGETLGTNVRPDAMMAYIAAVAAHPGYTSRFRENLKQPGLRIPITADRGLFDEAVGIGREVIWLHTFGERFADGRPTGAPRVTDGAEPTIPKGGALPTTLADMPHDLDYDPAAQRLKVGTGFIDNVSEAVWDYEVSGKSVIRQWWSYRREDRSKPPMGDKRPPSPLSLIQPTEWLSEYTTELLSVLRVLTRLVALEPAQAALLAKIVEGPTLDAEDLLQSGEATFAAPGPDVNEEIDS